MNDSALYTGVDAPGIFGNEDAPQETKEVINAQEAHLKELTPKLQNILSMIDSEIKSVMSIDRFTTATIQSETDIRAELQAAALYKKYLDTLKTQFTLVLNEVNK